MTEKITLEQKVLSENDRLALANRERWQAQGIFVINLVSSPGSGKTSLIEHTVRALNDKIRLAVIAGDVQTENDAKRIAAAGGRIVKPIVTGGACHLDARMVTAALESIDLGRLDLLIIENVGNLVCPAAYDLGEDAKVVVMSTTEGDDKPLKYPAMYRRSSVVVINKIDLLGTSDFDLERARRHARQINGDIKIIETSCRSAIGLEVWYRWLYDSCAGKRKH